MTPDAKPALQIDNEGNVYSPNRTRRRMKPGRARNVLIDYIDVPENKYTKSTHKIKKERAKNAKSKQERKRDVARARKARKESYTQVS